MTERLWHQFALARDLFVAVPSFENEGALIATYAEFARGFCPDKADLLINQFCTKTAKSVAAMRGA